MCSQLISEHFGSEAFSRVSATLRHQRDLSGHQIHLASMHSHPCAITNPSYPLSSSCFAPGHILLPQFHSSLKQSSSTTLNTAGCRCDEITWLNKQMFTMEAWLGKLSHPFSNLFIQIPSNWETYW